MPLLNSIGSFLVFNSQRLRIVLGFLLGTSRGSKRAEPICKKYSFKLSFLIYLCFKIYYLNFTCMKRPKTITLNCCPTVLFKRCMVSIGFTVANWATEPASMCRVKDLIGCVCGSGAGAVLPVTLLVCKWTLKVRLMQNHAVETLHVWGCVH